MDEQKVIKKLESEGYDKVWIYEAEPDEVDEEHTHNYSTKLHILSGYIRIKTLAGGALTDFRLDPGQEMEIPQGQRHSAKVSSDGCRYIVAEKH
jgi:hypothetical protein